MFLRIARKMKQKTLEQIMMLSDITRINSFMKEINSLICSGNQWTGFYMIKNSAMKELKTARL